MTFWISCIFCDNYLSYNNLVSDVFLAFYTKVAVFRLFIQSTDKCLCVLPTCCILWLKQASNFNITTLNCLFHLYVKKLRMFSASLPSTDTSMLTLTGPSSLPSVPGQLLQRLHLDYSTGFSKPKLTVLPPQVSTQGCIACISNTTVTVATHLS